jgi:hypothetical protein
VNQRADLPPLAAARQAARQEVEDPELQALPAPPKRERTLAAALMMVTTVASLAMCWALRGEVVYALAHNVPVNLNDLATVDLGSLRSGQYVEARGMLGTAGAIRYSRPLEGDSFRLQPVAGNSKLWVEIRVPEGFEGPRFVPPVTFAGRLVPLRAAGLRHAGIAKSVMRETSLAVPEDTWILVDGASPRASRWAIALLALFAFFAMWNLANVVRILRPVR